MELTVQQAMESALADHGANRLDRAEQTYRLILNASPNQPDALEMLGALLSQRGRHDEGLALIDRALALRPEASDYHANRGLILSNLGRNDEAVAAYRKALALRPDSPIALCNLGNSLQKLNQYDEAMNCYQRALVLTPNEANVHGNLGNLLTRKGRVDEAIAAYRRALELSPDNPQAMNNLAAALQRRGDLDEAIALFRRAVSGRPSPIPVLINLANALKSIGELDEAIADYDRILKIDSGSIVAHSSRVYTMLFHAGYDSAAIYAELRRWNDRHAKALWAEARPHVSPGAPAAERRLRVGYVSPNFFGHIVGRNLVPLFREHDHENFEIFCYHNTEQEDEFTEKFRGWADHWRPIQALSAQRAADIIRDDRIDILVDLSLHMHGQQLLIFARRPAPVQMTFAGYPGTTGVDAIDYRLTDPFLDPPDGEERFYSEKSIRLANSFWCYDPLTEEPAVNDLPALRSGHITFGCLSNFSKVNEGVIAVWARTMAAVTGSRLLMMAHTGLSRQRILRQFAEFGIEADRVEFVEFTQEQEAYLSRYHRIDIGLDTFPYNGHTTTLDSLWMGVPVVSLAGEAVVSRAGLSVLSNAGLGHLAAFSPEQFVAAAAALGANVGRLKELRRSLRERMRASPLMDAKGFARSIEDAYRGVWRRWCCPKPA